MKHNIFSHQGGVAALPAMERSEIEAAISACSVRVERRAAARIRERIIGHLGINGWPGEFQVEPPSKIRCSTWG